MKPNSTASWAVLLLAISGATAGKAWNSRIAMKASSSSAKQETLVGTISDAACGRKHIMMPKKSDAECTRICVRRLASRYALVCPTKVYILEGHEDDMDTFAGAKARVTGVITGERVRVVSVTKE